MIRRLACVLAAVVLAVVSAAGAEARPPFKVLAFYSTAVEPDHVRFAKAALPFFEELAKQRGFVFESATDWKPWTLERLKEYKVVVWLNDFPHTPAQRQAFEEYMTGGGGWLGFHVAAYNDRNTGWPWFVDFLGGGVFHSNNWPPLPARLKIDEPGHPVSRGIPGGFLSPTNEWYYWQPSPRDNPKIKVLATLDPSNYPLGRKNVLTRGDLPVVWTHTGYRMIYMNMGHGRECIGDETQNRWIEQALLWLAGAAPVP